MSSPELPFCRVDIIHTTPNRAYLGIIWVLLTQKKALGLSMVDIIHTTPNRAYLGIIWVLLTQKKALGLSMMGTP
jgi:hypothetical protein